MSCQISVAIQVPCNIAGPRDADVLPPMSKRHGKKTALGTVNIFILNTP